MQKSGTEDANPHAKHRSAMPDTSTLYCALFIVFAIASMPVVDAKSPAKIDLAMFLEHIRDNPVCGDETLLCSMGHILFGGAQEPTALPDALSCFFAWHTTKCLIALVHHCTH